MQRSPFVRSKHPPIAILLIAFSCHGSSGELAETPQAVGGIVPSQAAGAFGGTFSISPDGSSHYALPLWVSNGRAGVEPSLALAYSSRGGNGLVGVGWSLAGASSAIMRCGRTLAEGGPAGITFTASDSLCLDGNRLVKVAGASYYADGAEYRTELDTFAKIVATGADATGPTSFRVWTKDSRILTFGATADALLDAQRTTTASETTTRVRDGWLLERVEDRAGNYMTYTYGRPAGSGTTADLEFWLARIDYTGFAGRDGATALPPTRSVSFVYEPRADAIDAWISGVHVKTTRRLSAIEITGPGGPSPTLRTYRLAYLDSPSSRRSRLATIRQCDGLGVCLAPIGLEYGEASRSFAAPISVGLSPGAGKLFPADVNGDGYADLVYVGGDGHDYVKLWNGSGFGPSTQSDSITGPSKPFDIDGDGKVDVVTERLVTSRHLQTTTRTWFPEVHRSNGAMLIRDPAWDLPSSSTEDDLSPSPAGRIVDLDGDMLGDYVFTDPTGALLVAAQMRDTRGWYSPQWIADGVTPDHPQLFLDVDGDGVSDVLLPYVYGAEHRYMTAVGQPISLREDLCNVMLDANGDGLVDVVNLAGGLRLGINHGNGVFDTPADALAAGEAFAGVACADGSDQNVRVVDFNEDGQQDLLVLGPAGSTAKVWLSDGAKFRMLDLGIPLAAPNGLAYVLDANGDGLLDILQLQNGGAGGLHLQQGGHGDLLVRVTDALGAKVEVNYAPLTAGAAYTPAAGCSYPDRCYLGPFVVAVHEWRDLGQPGGDLALVATHAYGGMRASLEGDGLLGFASHTVTDANSGAVTRTTYDQTRSYVGGAWRHPKRGMPVEVLAYVRDGGTWHASRTRTSYTTTTIADRWFVTPTSFETRVYEGTTFDPANPDAAFESDGVMRVSTTTASGIDEYGNITTTEVLVGPVATFDATKHTRTTSTRTYDNHPETWLIGRITREVTTDATPNGAATRTIAHDYDANGLERTATREPDDTGSLYLHTRTTRDAHGLPTASSTCTFAGDCRGTTTVWDAADYVHPIATTNALGHRAQLTWAGGLDVQLDATDPDGRVTAFDHDGFGRLTRTTRPDGVTTTIVREAFPADAPSDPLVETVSSSDGGLAKTRVDRLGRTAVVATRTFDGRLANVATTYDGRWRVACSTRPYVDGATPIQAPCYEYDNLDRPIRVHQATWSQQQQISYAGNVTTTIDEAGARSTTEVDASGHVITTAIYPAASALETHFTYGPFDAPLSTKDARNNVTTMEYDRLGRRISHQDGDSGRTDAAYDGFGEIVSTTDAKHQTTTMTYDALGRPRMRAAPDGIDQWLYDPLHATGALASKTRAGISTSYLFDELGQLRNEHWTVEDDEFDLDYEYADGRLTKTTFPDDGEATRFAIQRSYTNGYVSQLTTGSGQRIWRAHAIDAEGHVTREQLGTDAQPYEITTTRDYDPATGRLARISTPGIPYYPYDLRYTYQPNGNMASRTDGMQGRTETFSYDGANRLVGESLSGAQPASYAYGSSATFKYDELGNIVESTDYYPGCRFNYAEPNAGPHQMTSLDCPQQYSYVFPITYDANGNMTWNYREGLTATWTSFNKPLEIQNGFGSYGRVHYTYDADHQRVKKETLAASGTEPYAMWSGIWGTTLSIGPYQRRSGGQMTTTDHVVQISVGGRAIAQRMWRATGSSGSEQWSYYQTDALGSIDRTTDASGAAIEWASFDAFGGRRAWSWDGNGTGPAPYTRLGYTGHGSDDEFGFVDMGGRIYDPAFKRFLSADSVVPDPLYGPSWNRYSYVYGNPLTLTDPSGHAPSDARWNTPFSYSAMMGAAWLAGYSGAYGKTNSRDALIEFTDKSAFKTASKNAMRARQSSQGAAVGIGVTECGALAAEQPDKPDEPVPIELPPEVITIKEDPPEWPDATSDSEVGASSAKSIFYGHYEILFSDGLWYIGKGSPERAIVSARQRSGPGVEVVEVRTGQTKTPEEAFLNEDDGIMSTGGPGKGNKNIINSPGRAIRLTRAASRLNIFLNILSGASDIIHMTRGDHWGVAPGLEELYPLFGKWVPADQCYETNWRHCG